MNVRSSYGLFVLGRVLELDAGTIDQHRAMKGGHVEIEVERHGVNYQVGRDRVKKLNSFRDRP